MPGDNTVTRQKGRGGRDPSLTPAQEVVVRELYAKGQSYEQLAVGFGVSYNTIRSVCKEPSQTEEEREPE